MRSDFSQCAVRPGGTGEEEPEEGDRPIGRGNERGLIPTESIASKWKHGEHESRAQSKAGCILPCLGKWSAVAGADGFAWSRALGTRKKEETRKHGERGIRHFKRENAPERER